MKRLPFYEQISSKVHQTVFPRFIMAVKNIRIFTDPMLFEATHPNEKALAVHCNTIFL